MSDTATRTYTEAELHDRLRVLAWLVVECVDDHFQPGELTWDPRIFTPRSATTNWYLTADYDRQLRDQGVPAAERRTRVAAYRRYLAGEFPDDTVPVMIVPRPSWAVIRELLHDKGNTLAQELSRPDHWSNESPE